MTDIVERLLGSCLGTPAQIPWPHSLLHDAVNEILALRSDNERLRATLLEKTEETLWYAYHTGIEKPDGQWTHCFMSDGEDLIAQIGLDPSLGYYEAEQVKAAIPAAARAALEGK